MTKRRKRTARAKSFLSEINAEFRAKRRAAIAAIPPGKIDAILQDLHGTSECTTYGEIMRKHGITDSLTLLDIKAKYTDVIKHEVHHVSIADAKAFRAKRRASYKAARKFVREQNEAHMRKAAALEAATKPEGSPS